METCFGSFFFAFFIYLVLRNLLFYTALKYSRGAINQILFLTFVVDMITLFMFPILIIITSNVCGV